MLTFNFTCFYKKNPYMLEIKMASEALLNVYMMSSFYSGPFLSLYTEAQRQQSSGNVGFYFQSVISFVMGIFMLFGL